METTIVCSLPHGNANLNDVFNGVYPCQLSPNKEDPPELSLLESSLFF